MDQSVCYVLSIGCADRLRIEALNPSPELVDIASPIGTVLAPKDGEEAVGSLASVRHYAHLNARRKRF